MAQKIDWMYLCVLDVVFLNCKLPVSYAVCLSCVGKYGLHCLAGVTHAY